MVEARLEAVISRNSDVKSNTIISVLWAFEGEFFTPANPTSGVMSAIPCDCQIFKKSNTLPELLCLKLIEANYKEHRQMKAINE